MIRAAIGLALAIATLWIAAQIEATGCPATDSADYCRAVNAGRID